MYIFMDEAFFFLIFQFFYASIVRYYIVIARKRELSINLFLVFLFCKHNKMGAGEEQIFCYNTVILFFDLFPTCRPQIPEWSITKN